MYFTLFQDIKLVRGANRSSMIDLRSNTIQLITNEIASFINQGAIDTTKLEASQMELLDYLVSKELGFYCESIAEAEMFPPINEDFDHPSNVSNAIIEVSDVTTEHLPTIFSQLEEQGCHALELRLLGYSSLERVYRVIELADKFNLSTIKLCLNYSPVISLNTLIELVERPNIEFTEIVVFSFPEELDEVNETLKRIRFVSYPLDSNLCGVVANYKFITNVNFFNESIKHNNCLNRKVSVDANGFIKHCPSMKQQFGNIAHVLIKDVLEKTEFTEKWQISKSQIKVCQDCEFRQVCMDCRAFTANPEDDYSKPLKCGYDPYSNEWSDWSTNPLSKKAMEFYELELEEKV